MRAQPWIEGMNVTEFKKRASRWANTFRDADPEDPQFGDALALMLWVIMDRMNMADGYYTLTYDQIRQEMVQIQRSQRRKEVISPADRTFQRWTKWFRDHGVVETRQTWHRKRGHMVRAGNRWYPNVEVTVIDGHPTKHDFMAPLDDAQDGLAEAGSSRAHGGRSGGLKADLTSREQVDNTKRETSRTPVAAPSAGGRARKVPGKTETTPRRALRDLLEVQDSGEYALLRKYTDALEWEFHTKYVGHLKYDAWLNQAYSDEDLKARWADLIAAKTQATIEARDQTIAATSRPLLLAVGSDA